MAAEWPSMSDMSDKAKKVAVLEHLKNAGETLGLPELLALLPPGYAERSVRRWLAELVGEGAVIKSGRKRGTRYRASDSTSKCRTASAKATGVPALDVPAGFDAVRVHYRQERREAIAEIVAQCLTGSALTAHARASAQRVPAADRDHFAEDLREDLALLSPIRIAGTGITEAQLRVWLAARNRD